jgi:hypothetical protein
MIPRLIRLARRADQRAVSLAARTQPRTQAARGASAPPRAAFGVSAAYVTSQVVGCGWSIRGLPSIGTRKNTTPSSTGSAVSFRPT